MIIKLMNAFKTAIESVKPTMDAPLLATVVTTVKPANSRFFEGAASPKAGAASLALWSAVQQIGKRIAQNDQIPGSYLLKTLPETLVKFDPAKLDALRAQYGIHRPQNSNGPEYTDSPVSRPAPDNTYTPRLGR